MHPETVLFGEVVGFSGDQHEFVRRTLYEEMWPRWEPLQDELEIVAIADPDEGARREADALVQGVRTVLADIHFYGVKRAENGVVPLMDESEQERVNARYDEAKAHGQKLAMAIQNAA